MRFFKNLLILLKHTLLRLLLLICFPALTILFTLKSRYLLSIKNFIKSYIYLIKNPKYLFINLNIFKLVVKSWKREKLDYGKGFLYQSFENIGIFGLRATNEKINMIKKLININNLDILDIGSNSGFVSIELSIEANNVDGVEPNKFILEHGNLLKEYYKLNNINFFNCKFEEFMVSKNYDIILSFANHSTYDGETEFNLDEYFLKISELLSKKGKLIFESHHPYIEKDLTLVEDSIKKFFNINKVFIYESENFIDNGRTWMLCERK